MSTISPGMEKAITEGQGKELVDRNEKVHESKETGDSSDSPPFENDYGAFVSYFTLLPPESIAPRPLEGLKFAVKDIFDVAGHVTGFGNPDWRRTHKPAGRTAPAVQLLLNAGAVCIGSVHMDEMAYSICGENWNYGTPVNPAAPSRMPGGSSSGSGVVVAAKLVDFSLGTDTGGSVRIPAAYCGILGFRPSHGAVSTVGVIPMAQSLDTAGWFASDVTVFRKVGDVLLSHLSSGELRKPKRFLIADDCFGMTMGLKDVLKSVAEDSISKTYGYKEVLAINLGEYIAEQVCSLKEYEDTMTEKTYLGPLGVLDDVLTLILRWEFKMNYEEWVSAVKPNIGPDSAFRVKKSMSTTSHLMTLALKVKEEVRYAINELLKDDVILVMPTAPGSPPKLKSQGEDLEDYRSRAFALLGLSVLASCPQVSIPAGELETGPVAISFLARRNADHFLLDTAAALYSTIQVYSKYLGGLHANTGTLT